MFSYVVNEDMSQSPANTSFAFRQRNHDDGSVQKDLVVGPTAMLGARVIEVPEDQVVSELLKALKERKKQCVGTQGSVYVASGPGAVCGGDTCVVIRPKRSA